MAEDPGQGPLLRCKIGTVRIRFILIERNLYREIKPLVHDVIKKLAGFGGYH